MKSKARQRMSIEGLLTDLHNTSQSQSLQNTEQATAKDPSARNVPLKDCNPSSPFNTNSSFDIGNPLPTCGLRLRAA